MASRIRVALCSHRLGGTDGVSIESAKWRAALIELGHEVVTVAGSGTADVIIPAIGADVVIANDEIHSVRSALEAAFSGFDLVIVENICSLKLNPQAAELISTVLRNRHALFHHHDLAIERVDRQHLGPPQDDAQWSHVCISLRARIDLARSSIAAVTLYNHFDVNPKVGEREATRQLLGVDDGTLLVLQPTRAIARKNIAAAIAVAEAIGATFWLLGNAEDGYDDELERICNAARTRVIRKSDRWSSISIDDAYAASDLVTLTSTWEGFGNPTIESATHRRPLVIGDYPVARELAALGFRWFGSSDYETIKEFFSSDQELLIEHNAQLARQHFAIELLPERLSQILNSASR